ncbi:MAG: nitrite oxidoreductase gamma subunit [Candidatus Scalindua rubra]|uniref:Nitrite oxidoreductase gamma subunit n=1 Tax=Candidatus Scalindua rubra TaxID=1872076 RepID=A0A1E3XG42_9BACT|nr:MAG: nitrite oxidoreductase gamma subunit [Candidatus Scalindua rubra]
MLKELLVKSAFFVSIAAAFVFTFNDKILAQGLEKEASIEENIPTKTPLIVKYLNLDINSTDKAFEQVDPLKIELQIQDLAFPNGGGSVTELEVRGFHNGETIFFGLTWSDETRDERAITSTQYRDAVGMMFPLDIVTISPETPFSPRMGDRGRPVNIWHWKADWEKELHLAGGYEHMEDQYPNMNSDFDFDPNPLHYHKEAYESVPLMAGGIAGGSILSKANRGRSVEDMNAIGFGTLTSQAHQDVKGKGTWANGKWNVVVYRSLITPDKDDVQFVPGMETFFNVAVWNGNEGDRDGQKSISIRWSPLKIERVEYLAE